MAEEIKDVSIPDTSQATDNPAGVSVENASSDGALQQQSVDATAGVDRKIAAYRAYIDSLPELETSEKRAKREKLEKSKRIVGAVSDGLRAMSNLWFTSRYAPNMYNHEKDSQLNETNRWIDKAKAEREKMRDEHLRFAIGLGDAESERAKTLRELEEQQERLKAARAKAEHDKEMRPLLKAIAEAQGRKEQSKAITAQAEAEYAPELQQAKIATEKARKGSLDASAANSRASAAAHGRSNVSEFSAWDEHGNEHKFRTKEAAEAYAKQHGTWKEEDKTETTTTETRRTPESKPQQRTSTKATKGGHAGKRSPTGRQSPTA